MAKFCIFCGNRPTKKNKEHVIPRWLIKLTGDENRVVSFGHTKSRDSIGDIRQFAFDQFTFPACEACNSKYSKLEDRAQVVMKKILHSEPVIGEDLSVFLDWFDKVRVGLWLGFQQLEKNFLSIQPNFHIERRIGQYDRALMIAKSDEGRQRLNLSGADSVSFAYTPAAFSLTVNNFYFVNISYSFLFARRIGYPFPDALRLVPDRDEILTNIQDGRERIMLPLINNGIPQEEIRVYQPMFRQQLMSEKSEEYDTEYVRANSFDHDLGIGAVFVQTGASNAPLRKLEKAEQMLLQPKYVEEDEKLAIQTVINTCKWQNWLTVSPINLGKLLPEQRKYVRSVQKFACGMNDVLIRHHERLLRLKGYVG